MSDMFDLFLLQLSKRFFFVWKVLYERSRTGSKFAIYIQFNFLLLDSCQSNVLFRKTELCLSS